MVNKMADNIKYPYLVSLNGEYLYVATDDAVCPPLRMNRYATYQVQESLKSNRPDANSCIKSLFPMWGDGKLVLATDFNPTIKCLAGTSDKFSHQTKTEICYKCLCNGKCTDDFMRNTVARHILPKLYNDKQK
jgi:hypothetical protein